MNKLKQMLSNSSELIFVVLALGVVIIATKSNKPVDKGISVLCETSKGPLEVIVKPTWSPKAAERFLKMVDDGYYQNVPFFRCMNQFVCQFGPTPPRENAKTYSTFEDDRPLKHLRYFKPGYLSFAGYGPNSRATHIFIALNGVESLGREPWETPFAYVSEPTVETIWQLSTAYGETSPQGKGPEPQKIEAPDGAEYLKKFAELDYIQSCVRK